MSIGQECQACGSKDLDVFFEVGKVPVHSCLMVKSREEALAFPTGDLAIGLCNQCGFIQNTAFDASVHNYSPDYEETQGFSPRFRDFQTELCAAQNAKYDLSAKTVLELGCGKGEFLVQLCEISGASGIGIDPSYRPERTTSAAAERIEFIVDFYSEKFSHLTADYVCCRHTLEHIQPVKEFVQMVRNTLDGRPDTIVFFEIPDGERLLVDQAFEDIYYEHCTYFTKGSLARLFRSCGFEILDLYKGFDDQYLMIECKPGDPTQGKHFPEEDDLEQTKQQVLTFRNKIEEKFKRFRADIKRIVDAGEKVVLWGSGSKAVSYLTTLGITDEVEYVVDINPHKWGKFVAGTGHEIVPPEFLKDYKPENVLVMNAIYIPEITQNLLDMGLSPKIDAV